MRNVLTIILISLCTSVSATTYYIDPSGSNSNNGSSESPWLTLAYACSKTTSGDIIHINAGTYDVDSQCSLPVGVSIAGEGDASLIRTNYNAGEYNGTIRLASARGNPVNGNQSISYIKIDGLSSPGTTAIDIEFRYNISIHHVTIVNCSSHGIWIFNNDNTYPTPPSITYATGNNIHDCTFTNCENRFEGQSGFQYYNNVHDNSESDVKCLTSDWMKTFLIHDNVFTKVFSLTGWNFIFETWHFSDNSEIYNNIFNGNSSLDLSDIRRGNGTWGLKVYNNQFLRDEVGPTNTSTGCYTLNFEGWGALQYIYVYNNYFKNITSPISIGAYNQANCVYPDGTHWALDHIYIYYNVVENSGCTNSNIPSVLWTWDNVVSPYAYNQVWDNIFICNNDFVSTGDSDQSQHGLYITHQGETSNFHVENNIIKGCSGNAAFFRHGSNFNTISVQNNLLYDNGYNIIEFSSTPTNLTEVTLAPADPLFVSSNDFHLQAGSPAIGKGLAISGLTTDFDGNAVNDPPSIGAFEYGSAPPSPDIPVYQSSVIENGSSSILEMTYNLALDNIIPPASVFNVKVNSVARTVSSVSISGEIVLLTLSSPVVNGDIVTVSYTKSATNPLQTASGEQAATLSARAVTNNVSPAIPAYVSSAIQNATPNTLEITYNLNLATIVPAAASFNVKVNNLARAINSVTISGTKVLLTLSSPVIFGDIVTISYTKPATNPIQTVSGGQAETLSTQTAVNNVSRAIPAYVSSAIQNATPNILEITYNLSLAIIVPSSTAFTVNVNSVVRTVNTVSVSGTKVLLTLASPVIFGDIVTISYTKPATNPIQTVSGGQAETLSTQTAVNNVSRAIPAYVSSAIQNATPNTLEITYNLSLAIIVPSSTAFTVNVNSVVRTVNTVSVSGTKVLLTLANAIIYGDAVTVSYTKPATNPIQTSSGEQAVSISSKVVINNVNPGILPVYVNSSIENATPTILGMTYNLNLASLVPSAAAFIVNVNSVARTVNSVSISGTKVLLTLANPVINGDLVTVAYTKPATNPIQTSSGGQAASISSQIVVNNVNPATPPFYINSAIENATPAILEMTYNLSLANIVPAASAFTVTVNSLPRYINTVSISGTRVLLTLLNQVVYGDIVTVAYTKSASNPLQTPSGGTAASISAQSVTNKVTSPVTLGYINSAVGNGNPAKLEINYNLTLANLLPTVSAFNVLINSIPINVNSVSITGNSVNLILATPVVFGDVITVAYTKPATNPLQSTSGLQASTMSAQPVTNKVDPVGPVYISSVIENITPSILEITYNEPLDVTAPDVSAFVVIINGIKREVTSVSISGYKVMLKLASPVVYGDVITVSYIKPASNQLKKATGETAVSFSFPQPVTNKVARITIKKGDISVYPNPAREFVNISILETSKEPQKLRIFDLSGKLCMESKLNSGTNNKVIIDIKSGTYIVQIVSGSEIKFVQKLIVINN